MKRLWSGTAAFLLRQQGDTIEDHSNGNGAVRIGLILVRETWLVLFKFGNAELMFFKKIVEIRPILAS